MASAQVPRERVLYPVEQIEAQSTARRPQHARSDYRCCNFHPPIIVSLRAMAYAGSTPVAEVNHLLCTFGLVVHYLQGQLSARFSLRVTGTPADREPFDDVVVVITNSFSSESCALAVPVRDSARSASAEPHSGRQDLRFKGQRTIQLAATGINRRVAHSKDKRIMVGQALREVSELPVKH